ncbi:DnaA/Hda family protein [Candidatus Uabimicrobium amorphum]|uniref:Chromosomal replication initiator protein DnaA1 n=1 Tax=Uabimicrobium amorphum TaxID=2596890 RepID=A0A5S9ITT1_UABAM|nr:DnaA/Hda family protein [Candidatus Uabimicrobium amorphum]BBM86455.1 chromosomal replication initiator protein DnaA1 [Candidatus Uabimicrobium amorphum]
MQKKHTNDLRRFLVDSNNNLAFEIAKKLIKTSKLDYAPLHIFGPENSGKSHLLNAISKEIDSEEKNIIHCFARSFYLDYIFALKNKTYQKFRQTYRETDILVLEDIDFLQKKNHTQRELLFVIDELVNKKKVVITSSQMHPKQLKQFQSALVNRLSSGLSIPIHPISNSTAQNYFGRMANNLQVSFEDGALQIITSECIHTELREKIEKLIVFCSETKKGVNEDLIKKCIAHNANKKLTFEIILEVVAQHYKMEDGEVLRQKQSSHTAKEPRYLAIKMSKEALKLNNESIASYFNCSESSVRNACKRVDKEFSEVCVSLKKNLLNYMK